jgi:hypothetical protein
MHNGVRAFILFNHGDEDAEKRLKAWFKRKKGVAHSYKNIPEGIPFKPEVLLGIEAADIVFAFWPSDPALRDWVLQEIGYVVALNTPLITIIEDQVPKGLIADIQALQAGKDWLKLESRLRNAPWKEWLNPPKRDLSRVVATIVDDSSDRVKLFVRYGEDAKRLGRDGPFRQSGSFSSFCIPNEAIQNEVWRRYSHGANHQQDYHKLKRKERQIFEAQVRRHGCKLILDPQAQHPSSVARRARLEVLLNFLRYPPRKDERVQAVTRRRPLESSLTIFGRSWVAESFLRPEDGHYRDAIFTWHPMVVKQRIADFDDTFASLCKDRKVAPRNSRELAIEDIEQALAACP